MRINYAILLADFVSPNGNTFLSKLPKSKKQLLTQPRSVNIKVIITKNSKYVGTVDSMMQAGKIIGTSRVTARKYILDGRIFTDCRGNEWEFKGV